MTHTADQLMNSSIIAGLNDAFRNTFIGGEVRITQGFNALNEAHKSRLVKLIQAFDGFTEGNDPHLEHDFGSITFDGVKIFWKIDYYDLAKEYGSENPADPKVTTRVMTLMLAEEY